MAAKITRRCSQMILLKRERERERRLTKVVISIKVNWSGSLVGFEANQD
jgi:hypothetical protein